MTAPQLEGPPPPPYPPGPPYWQQQPYRPPQWPGPARAGWIGTFAVLQIVVGGLGLLGLVVNAALKGILGDLIDKYMSMFYEGPMRTYMTVGLVVGAVASCALIAAGIGILKRKKWGRFLGLGTAGFNLVQQIVGQVLMAIYVYPLLSRAMDSSDPTVAGGAFGALGGGIIGALVGLSISVATLIALTRPKAREEISL